MLEGPSWEGKEEATTASAPDLSLRKLNSAEQITAPKLSKGKPH